MICRLLLASRSFKGSYTSAVVCLCKNFAMAILLQPLAPTCAPSRCRPSKPATHSRTHSQTTPSAPVAIAATTHRGSPPSHYTPTVAYLHASLLHTKAYPHLSRSRLTTPFPPTPNAHPKTPPTHPPARLTPPLISHPSHKGDHCVASLPRIHGVQPKREIRLPCAMVPSARRRVPRLQTYPYIHMYTHTYILTRRVLRSA